MDKKYLKRALTVIASSLVAILALFYIVRTIFDIFSADMEVTLAQNVEWEDTVSVTGTIFRNEKILYTEADGSINHLYKDGVRVGANTVVATVFNGTADSSAQELSEIDRKIKILTESNKVDSSTDTSYIDSRISKLYYLIRLKAEQGNLEYAEKKSDELLVLLNQRQIIINAKLNYNAELSELERRRAEILTGSENSLASVKTAVSGYYYSDTDGYENVFTASALEGIGLNQLRELLKSGSEDVPATAGAAVGKIATDADWYLCVIADEQTAAVVSKGKKYKVSFPGSADEEAEFILSDVLTDKNSTECGLIFKTDILLKDFTYKRTQTVIITHNTVKGLRVPTSAVRVYAGKTGVFILDDNITTFREINILLQKEGYYIVSNYNEKDREYAASLHLYDSIVTQGKGITERRVNRSYGSGKPNVAVTK